MSGMSSVLHIEEASLAEESPELARQQPENYHDARDRAIARFETDYLTSLLDFSRDNLTAAARIAGVDRTTLYRLMERHGLRRQPRPRRRAGIAVVAGPASPPAAVRIELP